MYEIGIRIYYLATTGEVVCMTSERISTVPACTKAEDMLRYPQLKDKNIDEIAYVELEYGTFTSVFTNTVKSYSVNIDTKKLEVIYYTQEEIDALKAPEQPIETLTSRVSTISKYLSIQDSSIVSNFESAVTNLEDIVISTETNKLTNGGI
jgi:hypothetical protein